MTDNEIIAKLQHNLKLGDSPIGKGFGTIIDKQLLADTIALIRRQQAEIDRLKTEKDNLIKTYAECQVDFLKEFVNKLKTWHSYAKYDVAGHQQKQIVISEVSLDNLVKEMAGDSNA